MYLFDTDTITNLLKKKSFPGLVKRLSGLGLSSQFLSTVSISEIVYGANKSSRPSFHMDRLEKILLPAVNIVSFDGKAAYVCGRLRAELEKRGEPLSFADLQIASIAMANGFVLVSGNTRHFSRIKALKTENWLK